MLKRTTCLSIAVLTSILGFSPGSPVSVRAAAPPASTTKEVVLPDAISGAYLDTAQISADSRFALVKSAVGKSIRHDLATGANVDLPQGNAVKIGADGGYVLMGDSADVFRHEVIGGTDLHITVPPGITVPGSPVPAGYEIAGALDMSTSGTRIAYAVRSGGMTTGDVLVYDTVSGVTYQARTGIPSRPGININNGAADGSLSADGRYLAFSYSDNFDGCASGYCSDIWVKDLSTTTLTPVSKSVSGDLSVTGQSFAPVIAAGGGAVLFYSFANDLVAPSTPSGQLNAYVWTRATNSTIRLTLPTGFTPDMFKPGSITSDGQLVGLTATNSSGTARALVADLTGTTATLMDSPLAGPSEGFADISADGSFALVTSAQTDPANLVDNPNKLYKVSLLANAAFNPLVAPARLLDTRPGEQTVDGLFAGGGLRPGGAVLELDVTGRGGIPADASAVVLNVTATQPVAAGFITVYPCGVDIPKASNLNFVPGDTVPNAVIAKIGQGGKVCLYSNVATHLIADVAGYFG